MTNNIPTLRRTGSTFGNTAKVTQTNTSAAHRNRLASDYRELMSMVKPGGMIARIIPTKGRAPYVEEYRIDLRVKTITSPRGTITDRVTLLLTLPSEYPVKEHPILKTAGASDVFNPNFYTSGVFCHGKSKSYEPISSHLSRAIRCLQYALLNPADPANKEANAWYRMMLERNPSMFPVDKQRVPCAD